MAGRTARKATARKASARKASARKAPARKAPAKGSPAPASFPDVYRALRAIFDPLVPSLVLKQDGPGGCSLETTRTDPKGRPMFFGGARIMKGHVSFHLMPVYVEPRLLDGLSPELRARMQGKSCFNFKRVDPGLFRELSDLARRGLRHFRDVGLA